MNDTSHTGVNWKDYVDRRFDDFGARMDERFRAQQEAIRVLVESNQRAFDVQGRRLAWFGVGLVAVQIVINVAFKLL